MKFMGGIATLLFADCCAMDELTVGYAANVIGLGRTLGTFLSSTALPAEKVAQVFAMDRACLKIVRSRNSC
jgi:hypothetical protein